MCATVKWCTALPSFYSHSVAFKSIPTTPNIMQEFTRLSLPFYKMTVMSLYRCHFKRSRSKAIDSGVLLEKDSLSLYQYSWSPLSVDDLWQYS